MAPSPTGPLHVGTARTALFNFLFARHYSGTFILRMEDTDTQRSEKRFEEGIIEGLQWLGITWDEGPYRQSERRDLYETHLRRLIDEGHAYYCHCTKEELDAEREARMAQGLPPVYGGRCRARDTNGNPPQIIRFRTPAEEEIKFKDIIRDTVSFNTRVIGDFAIAKDLRSPLYNFAVVVDDEDMNITHVIRGEDHISNTPRQILLQRALGFREVKYAHLPLILAPDRSKLSKRYLETSLDEYRKQGFLPDALVNFIALLGWHPARDREILSRDELIAEFDLDRVQKGGAVFGVEKLEWMNAHYLRELPVDALVPLALDALALARPGEAHDPALVRRVLDVERGRMKKIADIAALADFFFILPSYEKDLLRWKDAEDVVVRGNLGRARDALRALPTERFSPTDVRAVLDGVTPAGDRGSVFWPVRVALSGKKASPDPVEIMTVLGKDESLRRIDAAIGKFS